MGLAYADFTAALRARESGGDYRAVNSYGFLGAYQFGEGALIDLGFVANDGRWWDNDFSGGWTGKLGIDSRRAFLRSPEAQEAAADAWFGLLWRYLGAVGAQAYLGEQVGGLPITASGLIAGAHLLGAGGVRDWLESGGTLALTDAYGTPISEYIGRFSAYRMPFDTAEPGLGALDRALAAQPPAVAARIEAALDAARRALLGGPEAERLAGSAAPEVLVGLAGDDLLRARGGGDAALGGAGADRLLGGPGDDVLLGGGGGDLLRGQGGDDRVAGEDGADRLFGGGGADRLNGGEGDDVLSGGPGDDRLLGGAGADRFVFGPGEGADRIDDFDPRAGDVIDLSRIGAIEGWRDLRRDHLAAAEGALVIDLGDGGTIRIAGLAPGDLAADAFVF